MPGRPGMGPEAAAMPQDSLHSTVMTEWKESGQWRVRRGSDVFHESFYPEQSRSSGVKPGGYDPCSCF